MEIHNIIARQILDSRGNPTVEADVLLAGGICGRASVPSGASTGSHEAHELRDNQGPFHGRGVQKAVDIINTVIRPKLHGKPADDQTAIDNLMIDLDGSANKSKLGANAILAVSLACAHAAARYRDIPLFAHISDIAGTKKMSLPLPMMNVLNGGKHAAHSTDIQESMIIPIGAQTLQQAIQMGAETFQSLKKILEKRGYSTTVGDEGGFAPAIKAGNAEAFELLAEAVNDAGYSLGKDIALGVDVAATELYADGAYHFQTEDQAFSTEQLIAWYRKLAQKYPIVSIEDGLAEDDWEGWEKLSIALHGQQLVGDDLLVTNTERLQRAITQQAGNAILIKPNQVGTLTETIAAVQLAQQHNWNTIISHRSGETEDVTIAHIAVGLGAGQIKTGSLSRGERTAKYNELLRIEAMDTNLELANPFG